MHTEYDDIRSRIAEPPAWFDEHAVPRYVAFAPRHVANIYAREVCLVRIECQNCMRPFDVAFSWCMEDEVLHRGPSPSKAIAEKSIHFGDPPNIRCCPAGPTMNSVPRRVIEFWRRGDDHEWVRDPSLEVDVTPEWAGDETWQP